MIRKALAAAAMAAAALMSGCSKAPASDANVINFSILSAEDQRSMSRVWQPLLDDMHAQTGLTVKAFYATNYTSLIEAMRFKQVQIGWFSALPTLEAVRRADAEVMARVVDPGGEGVYESVLITRKGSGITLDDVLKCGKRYNFGIGDARSTSGTLAPMAYVFIPHKIEPSDCFKVVRSASHQSNLFSVANGVLDVATNNTVGLLFAKRENPDLASKIQVIWTSPPLPESSIVVRNDLDPAVKAKLKTFFLQYGTQPGPQGDHERAVLKGLAYGGFRPADPGYLDPVIQMDASQALYEARRSGDAGKIAAAQSVYDSAMAQVASHHAAKP
ncbi:MAG: phosphate/phosphite/phosphonate ABC transporter substrate-binding protein [Caulobacteraceae bacterium]|nr:phosphate/phosphite/phosphonate ABC transporter substrate-binding protein [Caulobacteraceae bacterium]